MTRYFFLVTAALVVWCSVSSIAHNECEYDRSYPQCHPLDPLSEIEIKKTASIIANYRRGLWVYIALTLKEPQKKDLWPSFFTAKMPKKGTIPRKAFVLLVNRLDNRGYEALVNLESERVEYFIDVPHKIPTEFTYEEAKEAEKIMRKDARVQMRCAKQGFHNMSLVVANTWSMGYIDDVPEYAGKRVVQLFVFGKKFEHDNQFTHPFDFMPIIDLNQGLVLAIEELPSHDDNDANNKLGTVVPMESFNYRKETLDPSFYRKFKPLEMRHPGGVNFKVRGHQVEWQNFKFRIGYDGRKGLIIHHVTYTDKGNVRPLFYRMSLSEVFVPYGDPRPPYHRKNAYDASEFGIGFGANSLVGQMDCMGTVEFIDFVLHKENGDPWVIPKAVCISEEDNGILWKKTDTRFEKAAIVRSQKLNVMFITTIGNYDYIVWWTFYQDATIQFNMKLTGILTVNLMATGATPAGHGTTVFPQINAQYHQHFFNLRLDAEIDGVENSVYEVETVSMDEPSGSDQNPYGSGMITKRKLLATAEEGRCELNPINSRTWHMVNPNVINKHTKGPVGWKLMPWPSPKLLIKPESPIHPRVEWLDYPIWVSAFKEEEFYPGGFYLNNSGLPEWVRINKDENLENTDIVIWHNIGISHVPRTEDYPVMPSEVITVTLKPVNFFDANPSLDVPPPNDPRDGFFRFIGK